MTDINLERFDSALYALPYGVANLLKALPSKIKSQAQEIRLRADKPLTLTIGARVAFVDKNGCVSFIKTNNLFLVTTNDIVNTVKNLCNNSMYSHTEEIKQGFIAMRHGHRAGIAGNFSGDSVYDFSSVNIRIARQIFGAADFLCERYSSGGVLIAGPPGSGKTTVLRDFIRQLSDGKSGKYRRVAVVDTRGEISACHSGKIQNDLGDNTDVLYGIEKARGVEIALRTLGPDIIAFDEIGTEAELGAVAQCMGGGADVVLTAHIGKLSELATRSITRKLLTQNNVKLVAMLSCEKSPEIYSRREIERCLF